MGVIVTLDDRREAYDRFNKFFSITDDRNVPYAETRFYQFLGMPKDQTPVEPYLTWPEDAARKIQFLLGPNYETILKVYVIRRGNLA